MNSQPGFATVLLDTSLPQLDHVFEYRIPEALKGEVRVGSKVSVPLRSGARFSDAYVTAISEKPEFTGDLQFIENVISPVTLLKPDTLQLARKIADRQAGSAMDVLRLIIPARYVRAEKAFLAEPFKPNDFSGDIPSKPEEFNPLHIPFGSRFALKVPPRLEVSSGLTSSNWVKLFVALAAEQLAKGFSTVIAVPDFRDIEKLEQACVVAGLEKHFIRVDAKLSGQQRYVNYLRSLTQEPLIILGNRSATLAPAHNLGLLVVWDDGDHNFEEPLGPYAHARDVSLVRQSLSGCSLLFASHTRSLETQRLVKLGFFTEAPVDEVAQPEIVLTDANLEEGTSPSRIPGAAWLGAKKALERGPVLVQVASPGFSPALVCSACKERATCASCHGPLHLAHRNSSPSCRWCGNLNAAWTCDGCAGTQLRPIAAGTERTSDEIGRAFPGVKVIVADGQHIITSVPEQPAIIVATPGAEPLAEGGYAAILLLDGERLRGREAFRVDEDVLRNWSNTIALAKSDATVFINGAGQVLGQTLLESAQVRWAAHELADRMELHLPPAVRVVSVSGSVEMVRTTCDEIPPLAGHRVLGPVSQVDGSSRALIFFEYKDGEKLATNLRAAVISSATRSKKPSYSDRAARVLRLRVRFDDPDIDSL
ncbi:primosomal protein N' [Aurantimicrobium sp. MWH-Uga1]|uniref:primosomal protein N' family DNA-binding protein n=1 Tax=Aurantimicrobium sp. MWH-Uga1 TaxID=2079575 RepID=UPI000DEDEDC0|nr:primosomal protein N' [Aurantimicrobium sp. MWH-Uga1]